MTHGANLPMRPVNSFQYFQTAMQSPYGGKAASTAQAGQSLAGLLAGGADAGTAAGPAASTQVVLSADARVLADFAGKGIAMTMRRLDAPLDASQSPAVAAPSVAKDDFERLLAQLGATQQEKNQIQAGLDTDRSGDISRNELLKGLAATNGATSGSQTSQALLHLMDRNGDGNGRVDAQEFGGFTAAFLDAEKRA